MNKRDLPPAFLEGILPGLPSAGAGGGFAQAAPSPGPYFSPLIAQLTPSLQMEAFGALVASLPNPYEQIGKIIREKENVNSELIVRFASERQERPQGEGVFWGPTTLS